MYIDLSKAFTFMLVLIRMTGLLFTNPILGRKNIPARVNAGLAFSLAVIITLSMDLAAPVEEATLIVFIVMGLKEFLVGMIGSFILNLFIALLTVGGEIMDMQLGIGMAKNFDPGTNASISLSATMFNAMFILIFFATNNHLTLIQYAAQSFQIIPVGAYGFNYDVAAYLPEFYATILIYAIKLCLPIVIMEIIVTMAVGMIMRVIPQINIFVVNIQFKLTIGIFALIILIAPFMAYLETLIMLCFEQIAFVWSNLAV